MFFSHIINLHTRKLSISKSSLNCKSWIIRMHMDFNNIFICYTYNRITYRFQKSFKFMLIFLCKCFFCHNYKFCTISKFDICLCLCIRLNHRCSHTGFNCTIINLFTLESIICTIQHFKKTLSARIHNSCFF